MKRNGITEILIVVAFIICLLVKAMAVIAIILGIVVVIAIILYSSIYLVEAVYFNSKKFVSLKNKLSQNTKHFNELNEYIKELKNVYNEYSPTDYGGAEYIDSSLYKFSRPNLNYIHNNTPKEYYCSLNVCRNAQAQPFKYLCKYFHIPVSENSLVKFEDILNKFYAAEEGRQLLIKERESIINVNRKDIPFIVRKFRKESFFTHLGWIPIDMSDNHYPNYVFKYISAGGNSQMICDIILDLDNLDRFVKYIYDRVELTKKMEYQRKLMTKSLRMIIKERDNYTCQKCGISVYQEPHLLLEIDHIIPISHNGKTTMDNLQTLCWKCNRQKSNKLLSL